jgi:hypothetical protein
MLTEDLQDRAAQGEETGAGTGASEDERRRAYRRKLPFGRGAVLHVGERSHIVGVADLSVTGAFLVTRAPVSVGETHVLKLLILPERVELALQAEVVRLAQAGDESNGHPRGVAVRFPGIDETSRGFLERYVAREPGSARR